MEKAQFGKTACNRSEVTKLNFSKYNFLMFRLFLKFLSFF